MTMPTLETRRCRADLTIETRGDGKTRLKGRALVYGGLSHDLGGWRERFAPGAVRRSVQEIANDRDPDLLFLVEHDWGRMLGRTSSGTLELRHGDDGLGFVLDVPDVTDGRDLMAFVRRGDMRAMSFQFRAVLTDWTEEEIDGEIVQVRTVVDADLYEISAVHSPAYPQTMLQAASRQRADVAAELVERDPAFRAQVEAELARRRIPKDDLRRLDAIRALQVAG
jgi:HK97 family phage prohead protease